MKMVYIADSRRHLVCSPYSIENLHAMALDLKIKRCWFHRDHYDIPKRRIKEIMAKCILTSSRHIISVINGHSRLIHRNMPMTTASRDTLFVHDWFEVEMFEMEIGSGR